ncbi:MAG: helix-turn-helix domain-containing protein [Clostridium butyricum]|uniref:helix-turn-helix domain-containing protein n=1 Tax=Clostridium sp. TaxID=1506 RepID=UPI00290265D8|nr:helix-turn-helix domain-containing protein [Clostridium sp.]MDU1116417.1 helix-turn-helix domain-containing protein [Clostridium sp.]MDU7711298.1 helix-turn-helix domain-containing protein [Clostridium butyricum]
MSYSPKMKGIIARMKKRREELNLSYEDLSKRTGLGSSTLQRYETGAINRIPVDRFEILARGLEIQPYKLMGWDEEYLLSQDQKEEIDADIVDLHKAFLKLNETGRSKVLGYVFDITSINKYVKNKDL